MDDQVVVRQKLSLSDAGSIALCVRVSDMEAYFKEESIKLVHVDVLDGPCVVLVFDCGYLMYGKGDDGWRCTCAEGRIDYLDSGDRSGLYYRVQVEGTGDIVERIHRSGLMKWDNLVGCGNEQYIF